MKEYKFYNIDAFTNKPFKGNRAGVVLDAFDLSEETMQNIAREVNASETAFITNISDTINIRFFTPTTEVAMCGHATIASFKALLEEKLIKEGQYKMKCKAGIVPVEIIKKDNEYLIGLSQDEIKWLKDLDDNETNLLLDALNINRENLVDNKPISILTTGNPKVIIMLKDNNIMNNLQVDNQKLIQLSNIIKATGYHVFTLNENEEQLINGRMFAPAGGIEEDPVTGNSVGPITKYLLDNDILLYDKDFNYQIKQGENIDKTGIIDVSVCFDTNKLSTVKYYGKAVLTIKGTINI